MAPSNHQKHQAGRHLAVAEALLQGYSASLEGPQTFVKINGRRAAVQVAAQGAWMIADVYKATAASIDFYVLVDVTDGRRNFYVVPGDDLRSGIDERHQEFMSRVGGVRPRNPDSRHTAIYPAQVEAWRNRWSLFDRAAQHAGGDASA
ncbi:hypothetical protein AB0F90_06655 [Micromonospora chalcea]|uniref:hypothetical protein n=1 Tax=Micromonospora TaxID=1873 RepID=UPI001B38D1C1|nr:MULTISPECIES: hypothetical protein [Micromonospora]MBQ1059834.1 hypothetical protein [Micromonospora sp. C41]WDQ01256.1 hypothetical protein PVK74_05535 [Micromonospora chalcea]